MAGGRSTIVIPVPEADPLIGAYRLRYDPPARRGMPAHVTLLYPFLPPDSLTGAVIERLETIFATEYSFPFTLPRTDEFPQDVLFLEPDPREPFIALTTRLTAEFGIVPYEGRVRGPRPHCTVTQEADELTRLEIEVKLGPGLPIESMAREAWLMTRDDESPWEICKRLPLSGS